MAPRLTLWWGKVRPTVWLFNPRVTGLPRPANDHDATELLAWLPRRGEDHEGQKGQDGNDALR